MVDYDREADRLSNVLEQQLAQFRTKPSRYGYEQLNATFEQFRRAAVAAQDALNAARIAFSLRVLAAQKEAQRAEPRMPGTSFRITSVNGTPYPAGSYSAAYPGRTLRRQRRVR